MLVRDLMNAKPATVRRDADLSAVLDRMGQYRTRHVVVLDENDTVVGIISDRDLAMYYDPVKMTRERWTVAKASDLMSPQPRTIGSAARIEDAARMLIESGFSGLPVIDSGTLVGMLTERDFVRYFLPK